LERNLGVFEEDLRNFDDFDENPYFMPVVEIDEFKGQSIDKVHPV
jgi:hypothetical protein